MHLKNLCIIFISMKQRLLLTFISLLILLPSSLTGSNIDYDSLRSEISLHIQNNKRKELMGAYQKMSKHYFDENNFKESLKYLKDGLLIAREEKDQEEIHTFLLGIGRLQYYPYDNYMESLTNLQEAEKIGMNLLKTDQSRKILKKQAAILSKTAQVYVNLGSYEEAISYQFRSNKFSNQVQDTIVMAEGYYTLGMIYWAQEAYDKAMENLKEALQLGQFIKDSRKLFTYMASVGATHAELKEYEEGMAQLRRAQSLATSIKHRYGVAYTEGTMGSIYKEQKKYASALESLTRSVEIFEQLKLRREYVAFQLETADTYNLNGEPAKALRILEKIDPIVSELKSIPFGKELYEYKSEAYEKLGQTEAALGAYKQFIVFKDSLFNEKKISQVAKAELNEKIAIRKAEEARENAERASERKYWITGGFLLFFLLLGAAVYWARLRNKELRESNQLLEAKTREIELQMERLASSNEELRQFAHVTSHDLREPLRSISSFTTLLKRKYSGKIDPEADEFIKFITNGVKRMDTLLSDLLAYSVVGIGRTEYEKVDINEVITGIIASLNRDKATQGARISIQNLPELAANKKQITQLFQHLIDNAIKFRREEVPEIKISCEKHKNGHLFSIQDNGIGMDEAYKDKIFGLFLRLHHKKTKYKGTGIGLSICKKIVEQHKGKIWIESRLGEGTTVFFLLPESPLETEGFSEPIADEN
jgi:signal transduction histidine kinase